MERQADERASLLLFLDSLRTTLLDKLDGLTLEQATTTPTVSALSVYGIVKHCAFVERRWVQAGIADREVDGIWPPGDRDQEFRADPDETVEWLRELYLRIADENRRIVEAVADLGAPLSLTGVDARWILLHLVEELARHAGHADIVRESIDGVVDVP